MNSLNRIRALARLADTEQVILAFEISAAVTVEMFLEHNPFPPDVTQEEQAAVRRSMLTSAMGEALAAAGQELMRREINARGAQPAPTPEQEQIATDAAAAAILKAQSKLN